jgi:hypothetical protein
MTPKLILLLLTFLITTGNALYDFGSINASPEYIEVIENITVRWKNISPVSKYDWIGIFSPTDSVKDHIGFRYVSVCPFYLSGGCSFQFELLNMRESYQFRYVWANGTVAAVSNEVKVKQNQPMQGHLQLTNEISQMRVMWVQGTSPTDSVVLYYQKGTEHLQIATGTSFTYSLDDIKACQIDSRAVDLWREPGQIHDVLLTGLKPGTTYSYRFGNGKEWSKEYSFTTRTEVGPDNGINVVTFGDMGTFRCQPENACETGSMGTTTKIWNQLQQGIEYQMVLQIGDISYAVGNAAQWDQFFWQVEPIATSIPWMTTIGNHEYDHQSQPFKPSWSNYGSDSGGECGIPFYYRFHPPNNDLWWSLDFGNVHFSLLSMEHDFTRGSLQYMWFAKDLATVDRSKTPFVIVGGHRPMYCSENSTTDVIMAQHIQEELEDLFYKYRVDLALWGHNHVYERTCPLYKGKCMSPDEGTVHAVIGMAGYYLDDSWRDTPAWSVKRDNTHYGIANLQSNSTALVMRFIGDDADNPLDEVIIPRKKFF